MFARHILFAGFAAVVGLSACDQYRETNLIQKRAVVTQERYSNEVPAEDVGENFYRTVARDYRRYGGDGDLYLSFIYHPNSRTHTAMSAAKQAEEAASIIRSSGVKVVKVDTLPISDPARDGMVVVSYTRYSAAPPPGCTSMPGLESMGAETDWDYKQGCGIETYLAKQIARPKDLAGRGGSPETYSGRRAAIMSNPYDAGVANQPLEGVGLDDIEQ